MDFLNFIFQPPAKLGHRRSKSTDYWLEHKPAENFETGTLSSAEDYLFVWQASRRARGFKNMVIPGQMAIIRNNITKRAEKDGTNQ